MDNLTLSEIQRLDKAYNESHPMLLGTKLQAIIDAINAGVGPQGAPGDPGPAGIQGPQGLPGPCTEILRGTPFNAISATKTLTVSNVVIAGETVSIGDDVYEFASDIALAVAEGNIPVDINAATAKATDGLTIDTKPSIGDTMTIGTKVFTFVPDGTANGDGEISVGPSAALLAEVQASIIAAIRGTDHNDPHPLVTCDDAFLNDVLAITALKGGVAGNDIATTETFTASTNVFSADKLANGSDCSAADAVTALVVAITASDTQGVGAAEGAGDTVILTSDLGGVIGNAISIGETMANGAFAEGAVLLSGGVDGRVGNEGEVLMDASYLYLCIADNDVTGKNWRRITLGNAF